jgi:hypothetical protein
VINIDLFTPKTIDDIIFCEHPDWGKECFGICCEYCKEKCDYICLKVKYKEFCEYKLSEA